MGISSEYRGRLAQASVERYRIVKAGSVTMSCTKAAAATDLLLGTSDELEHVTGEIVDVSVSPVAWVKLGGTVLAGAKLTSDANGKAVSTVTIGHQIIGVAEIGGVLDDEITYLRALGTV